MEKIDFLNKRSKESEKLKKDAEMAIDASNRRTILERGKIGQHLKEMCLGKYLLSSRSFTNEDNNGKIDYYNLIRVEDVDISEYKITVKGKIIKITTSNEDASYAVNNNGEMDLYPLSNVISIFDDGYSILDETEANDIVNKFLQTEILKF